MKNLQKIIATGALIGLSLIAGCKDSKENRAKAEMKAAKEQKIKDAREQRMTELRCGIIRRDSPYARGAILRRAHYVIDYNDLVSKKSGKIAIYGDETSQQWEVVYMPDN